MLHIITGDGKGKTTSAVGMAMRMAGSGGNVLFVQLFKGGESGEIKTLSKIENITIKRLGKEFGFWQALCDAEKKELTDMHNKILLFAKENSFDMIIVDEAMFAIECNALDEKLLSEIIAKDCEVVLTGRNAPKHILEKADYISEIKLVKHPFQKGVDARKGIEY